MPLKEGGTSSGNLYPQVNTFGEFLRSARFFHIYPQRREIPSKLLGRLEVNPGQTQAACRFHVSGDIVNIDRFLSANPTSPQSRAINERIRFTGAERARVNPLVLREVLKELVG